MQDQGWVPAGQLRVGDLVHSHDGQWTPVTAVELTGTPAQVYNFRIADYHTYFVGDDDWGFSVWVHNATTNYALGSKGQNTLVDSVAAEIEAAATGAEAILKAGGTGGTRWGRIYQHYQGTGHWAEKLAYGNAIQQIADNTLVNNAIVSGLIGNRSLLLNQGSILGIRSKILLRPDYQLDIGNGQWAIFDISTKAQSVNGKITTKYAHANSPFLVDISY